MENCRAITILLTALCGATAMAGCANDKAAPLTASSANQAGYAERYPDELATARGTFTEQESSAGRVMAEFSTYPDELDNPSWSHVTTTVARADEAGKSGAYVDRLQQNDAVVEFFAEEEQDINSAVGGAVQYAAKQKGVEGEGLGGAATGALKRSVEKQLEERLREHNEAHRFIEDNQEAIGKKNVEKLKQQTDKITYVSYVVHVASAQAREKLERMLDEGSQVKSTLDDAIEENNAVIADDKRAQADKDAAKKRVAAAEAAKARVDSEIDQARHVLTELEQRSAKLKKDYDAALDALRDKLEQKAAATPEKPAS